MVETGEREEEVVRIEIGREVPEREGESLKFRKDIIKE
jgi:hypothetical protein